LHIFYVERLISSDDSEKSGFDWLLFENSNFFGFLRANGEEFRPILSRMKVQVVAFHDRFGVAGLQCGIPYGSVQGDVVADEAVAHFIV
jgi:hypothetical protein